LNIQYGDEVRKACAVYPPPPTYEVVGGGDR